MHFLSLSSGLLQLALSGVLLPLAVASYSCSGTNDTGQGAPAYSIWMISSIISRGEGVSNTGAATGQIELGIWQSALRNAIGQYPDCAAVWSDYLNQSLVSSIPSLLNATADLGYPLDRFSIGNALLYQYGENQSNNAAAAELKALQALSVSQDQQPRSYLGGYWYYVYPSWSYLDGMYSLAPFLAHLWTLSPSSTITSNSSSLLTDTTLQLSLLWSHCYHPTTGLLVHGYDASRTAIWANPISGASPNVWGRSLGWYAVALVETLELLYPNSSSSSSSSSSAPNTNSTTMTSAQAQQIKGMFVSLSQAVVRAADNVTGAWWQMVEYPSRQGNYLESSATCLLTYALLKGVRLGFLVDANTATTNTTAVETTNVGGGGTNFTSAALKAYVHTTDSFVVVVVPNSTHGDPLPLLGFNQTVSVCSLNSTATYEYYISRPILYNSLIGTSAFILASLERELLAHHPRLL